MNLRKFEMGHIRKFEVSHISEEVVDAHITTQSVNWLDPSRTQSLLLPALSLRSAPLRAVTRGRLRCSIFIV